MSTAAARANRMLATRRAAMLAAGSGWWGRGHRARRSGVQANECEWRGAAHGRFGGGARDEYVLGSVAPPPARTRIPAPRLSEPIKSPAWSFRGAGARRSGCGGRPGRGAGCWRVTVRHRLGSGPPRPHGPPRGDRPARAARLIPEDCLCPAAGAAWGLHGRRGAAAAAARSPVLRRPGARPAVPTAARCRAAHNPSHHPVVVFTPLVRSRVRRCPPGPHRLEPPGCSRARAAPGLPRAARGARRCGGVPGPAKRVRLVTHCAGGAASGGVRVSPGRRAPRPRRAPARQGPARRAGDSVVPGDLRASIRFEVAPPRAPRQLQAASAPRRRPPPPPRPRLGAAAAAAGTARSAADGGGDGVRRHRADVGVWREGATWEAGKAGRWAGAGRWEGP
jgi:hypothetical protein